VTGPESSLLALILLSLLSGCIKPEQVAEDRLAPYRQPLLPTFQGDIAALGEIPRYRIAVRLDAEALTLTGAMSRCDALAGASHLLSNIDRRL
jgi:hypothetical protein